MTEQLRQTMRLMQPYPGYQPASWHLNNRILETLSGKIDTLADKGYVPLVGFEQEFEIKYPPHYPPSPAVQRYWNERKQAIIAELADQPEKAQAAANFHFPECVMYDLHKELGDLVEYRFGSEDGGVGWYDGARTLEIRTNPLSPIDAVSALHTVNHKLVEIAERYGCRVRMWKRHTNISVSDANGKNLMCLEQRNPTHTTDNETTKRLQEWMLYFIRDALPCIDDECSMSDHKNGVTVNAGPSRNSQLRMTDDHFELRVCRDAQHHPALDVLVLISGMEAALCSKTVPDDMQCSESIRRGDFSLPEGSKAHYLRTLLNGSVINADNTMDVDKKALASTLPPLLREVGYNVREILLDSPPVIRPGAVLQIGKAKVACDAAIPCYINRGYPRMNMHYHHQRMVISPVLRESWGKNLLDDISQTIGGSERGFVSSDYLVFPVQTSEIGARR